MALVFQQLRGYQEDTAKLFALVQRHTNSDRAQHNSFISKTSFIYLSPQAFLFVLPKEQCNTNLIYPLYCLWNEGSLYRRENCNSNKGLQGYSSFSPPINLQKLKEASSKRVCTAFILYNTLSISSLTNLRQRWQQPASLQQHKRQKKIHGEEGQSIIFYCWLNINNCLIDTKPHLLSTSIHWNLLCQWQIKSITQFYGDVESWMVSQYLAYF